MRMYMKQCHFYYALNFVILTTVKKNSVKEETGLG